MTMKSLTMCLAVFLSFGLTAQGAVYFHETFETLNIGDNITSSTPTSCGSWVMTVPSSGALLQVVADPAGQGGKCLKFFDTSTTEQLRAKAVLASNATESVKVKFDIYLTSKNFSNGFETYVGGPSSYTYNYTYVNANATVGVSKNYTNGTTVWSLLSDTLPLNTWIHCEMTFPAMPQSGYFTFHQTISAGGVTYFDGDLPSNRQNPTDLSYLLLQQAAASSQNDLYFDNIKVISADMPQVAAPTFSPTSGTYLASQNVQISCDTPNAVIHYTIDGTEPSLNSPEYTGSPIPVTSSTIVKARAWATGYEESEIVAASYDIDEPTVYFHETFETLDIGDNVTSSTPTSSGYGSWVMTIPSSGALLQVVADPAGQGGKCLKFSDTSTAEQLRAKAVWSNSTESVKVKFDVYLTSKGFSNAFETFVGGGSSYTYNYTYVTAGASAGISKNYTNGTSVWSLLSDALPLNTWIHCEMIFPAMPQSGYFTFHQTISAGGVTYFDDDLSSNWGNPSYLSYLLLQQPAAGSLNDLYFDNIKVIPADMPQVATPELHPAGGVCEINQPITLSCATPGAVIRYTTDGTEPTATSQEYSAESPILMTSPVTIKARAWVAGYEESEIVTASYKLFNRPQTIPYGNATVDGNLVDWDDAEWIPLDQVYDIDGSTEELLNNDIPSAFYAIRWGDNGNKVYVAVMVRDLVHTFSDTNTGWDQRDAVEIYLHTTGEGPFAYNATQADAQQYVVGFKIGGATVWSTIDEFAIPAEAGFHAAGSVDGDWLYYEVAMTPFKVFSMTGTGLEISTLSPDQVIGLDVCAVGHNGTKYVGMKSENTLPNKYNDYRSLGLHKLVAPLPGDANGDNKVDVGDLGILAANYGGTGKSWSEGDFNYDGKVDVGDLGILAANYGTHASSSDWSSDYAKVFGTSAIDEESEEAGSICSGLGLPLIAGLALMGLMLVKIDE